MGKEMKKPEIVDLFSMTRPELEDAYIKLYTKYAEAEAKLERFLQEIPDQALWCFIRKELHRPAVFFSAS